MKLKYIILLLFISLIVFFYTLTNYSLFLEVFPHEPYTSLSQQFYEAFTLAFILAILPWGIFIIWNKKTKK